MCWGWGCGARLDSDFALKISTCLKYFKCLYIANHSRPDSGFCDGWMADFARLACRAPIALAGFIYSKMAQDDLGHTTSSGAVQSPAVARPAALRGSLPQSTRPCQFPGQPPFPSGAFLRFLHRATA